MIRSNLQYPNPPPTHTVVNCWQLFSRCVESVQVPNWMLPDYNHWCYDGKRSCEALLTRYLKSYRTIAKRFFKKPLTHSHRFIKKALKCTTFQVTKRLCIGLEPQPHAPPAVSVLCVRQCVAKVAGLKQLCATDKPFVALRQTNFLNLWQPSDSSLYLFRLLSIQVTHRGLWNKQYFLSK